MNHLSLRLGAALALVLAGGAAAQAQVTLKLRTTIDGFTFSAGNPASVAAHGNTLFVGSLNGVSPGTITRINNPLTTPVSGGVLTGVLPVAGNGYVSLDTDGTTLVAASNNSAANDIVRVFDVATNALRYESTAAGLPGPGPGVEVQRIDGAAIDPNTGNVWLTGFGAGFPTILSANSLTSVSDVPSEIFAGSPTGTGFRDINFDPTTGDLYLRATNGVLGGQRLTGSVDDFRTLNSLGATAGFSQIAGGDFATLQDPNRSALNIEFLPASFTGTEGIFITNTRVATATSFTTQVLAFDADAGFDGANPFSLNSAGVSVPLTFLEADGVTPFAGPGSANGIYDFSFDPVNEVLYIADQANGDIYVFGKVGGAPLQGDANADGKVDLLDLDILGANFGSSPATLSQGDFNGDNAVNLLDLDILGANFGAMAPALAVAVPEPAGFAIVLAAIATVASRRRG